MKTEQCCQRAAMDSIQAQSLQVAANIKGRLAETIPLPFIVLNRERQIVFGNEHAVAFFGKKNVDELLGYRPGEHVYCVHVMEQGACGAAPSCAHCGTVKAVLGAASSKEVCTEESLVMTKRAGALNALNLRVDAGRLEVDGEPYTIVYLQDISRERDRELLEQLFMHDALNALGGISGAAKLLSCETKGEMRELAMALEERSSQLVRDVRFMQLFFAAEEGVLVVERESFSALEMLKELQRLFSTSNVAEGKQLLVTEGLEDIMIVSDRGLLTRTLENLVKNALEASRFSEPVTVGYVRHAKAIHFFVKNISFIPKRVQLQLFQRTFSTKGRGRGIGAYSARLFVENYLGGSVAFESSTEEGTTFFVQIPLTEEHVFS